MMHKPFNIPHFKCECNIGKTEYMLNEYFDFSKLNYFTSKLYNSVVKILNIAKSGYYIDVNKGDNIVCIDGAYIEANDRLEILRPIELKQLKNKINELFDSMVNDAILRLDELQIERLTSIMKAEFRERFIEDIEDIGARWVTSMEDYKLI